MKAQYCGASKAQQLQFFHVFISFSIDFFHHNIPATCPQLRPLPNPKCVWNQTPFQEVTLVTRMFFFTDVVTLESDAVFLPPSSSSSLSWKSKRSLASVILHQVSPGAKEGGGGRGGGLEGERQLVTSLIRRQTRTRSLAAPSGRRRLRHQRATNSRAAWSRNRQ